MTNDQAQRILNEIRADCPIFVIGKHRYEVHSDGSVNVWLAVGKSGKRWKSGFTMSTEERWAMPEEVREASERQTAPQPPRGDDV